MHWSSPEQVPALDAAHVHVWKASADELAVFTADFFLLLDAAERERHSRFHFERDAARFAVSHGLLRVLLAQYTGAEAAALMVDQGPNGKPHLTSGPSFNLSHSGDAILLAIARDANVGVDVEQWSDRLGLGEMERLADHAFSKREQVALCALQDVERAAAFYATWSRKEAYIKSTGIGITQGLDHFDVSCNPRDAQLIADRRADGNVQAWKLVDLTLEPGYSGALAVDRPQLDLHTLIVTPSLVSRLLSDG